MARVVWTEPALQDLDAIADYISLDKSEAARRLVQKVFQRVQQLEDHPQSGSIPPELRGTHCRHLVVPPLRIFYRQQKDAIYIIYVMRGERQLHEDDLQKRENS